MKHWEESWKCTTCSGVFLMNFEVLFHLLMKHYMSNAWYYFSNKKILDREIKDVKMSSFSSDYQTLPIYFLAPAKQAIDFNFLCIFFTNYRWVWEQGFNKALCSMTLCANHFPILSARTWTNLLGWNRCWLLIFISITPVVFIPTDQTNIR